MKAIKMKFYLSLFCLFLAFVGFAQELHPNLGFSKSDYEYRRKVNKKTANILLGSGAGLFAGGFLLAKSQDKKSSLDNAENVFSGIILMGAGLVSSLISVPFYLTAYNYKLKANATTAFLKMEYPPMFYGTTQSKIPLPALAVSIPLNGRK